MGKTRSQLRYVGQWPDGLAAHPAADAPSLTIAARRLAQSMLEDLQRAGVKVRLDGDGKARFMSAKSPSRDARRLIEIHADLIESFLVEQARRESGR